MTFSTPFMFASTFFDAEADAAAKAAADAAAAESAAKAAAESTANAQGKRTYSEEEYQKGIAAEKQRADESTKRAIAELETHKKNSSLSEAQKAELQKKIDDLNTQFMTKEQLAKQEKEKLVSTYESTVKSVTEERDKWKTRYEKSTIEREITDAAIKHDGYNTEMFLALLGPKTQVVEETAADGSTTYKVKVKLPNTDKDGKIGVLDLDPMQAVKQLKDKPEEYGFLFKGHTAAGVGGNSSKQMTKADYENMTIEEYAKHRKQIKGQ